MSNESRKKIKNDHESDFGIDSKQPDQSRRSFAKAGIIAPVIMSLANRPAWGAVTHRCNISGWASVPAVGEGSGIPPSSGECGFASAENILEKLNRREKRAKVSTIFDCLDPSTSPTVRQVLKLRDGISDWLYYMMIAHFNEYPPEDSNGKLVTSGNPLGCPVVDVFCKFYNGAERVDFGNVSLTQDEVEDFLKLVTPIP